MPGPEQALMEMTIAAVAQERERQYRRWGAQHHDPVYWIGILTEELGEAAREAIELRPFAERGERPVEESTSRLCVELLHLAAVAVAAMEDLYAMPIDGVELWGGRARGADRG